MRQVHTLRRSLRLFLSILLALGALAAASCGGREAPDPLAYLEMPFGVRVRGELTGIAFTGTLTLSSAANGGQKFCFDSPEALAGITLRRADGAGESAILLGQMQIPTDEWSAQGMYRLLLPLSGGQVISVTPREEGGAVAVIETADGASYTVTLSADGAPLFWEGDGFWMETEGE